MDPPVTRRPRPIIDPNLAHCEPQVVAYFYGLLPSDYLRRKQEEHERAGTLSWMDQLALALSHVAETAARGTPLDVRLALRRLSHLADRAYDALIPPPGDPDAR